MKRVLKITGIIAIMSGVLIEIYRFVVLIQVRNELNLSDAGLLLGPTFLHFSISGVICLGIAKIIELLENRD